MEQETRVADGHVEHRAALGYADGTVATCPAGPVLLAGSHVIACPCPCPCPH